MEATKPVKQVIRGLIVAALMTAILARMVNAGDDLWETAAKAVRAGDLEKVKELLNADPSLASRMSSLRKTGNSLLAHAITWVEASRKEDMVALLIDKGARVDVTDAHGDTPLHVATRSPSRDSEDIVLLLLTKGADVNAKNKNGFTPLYYAATCFSRERGDPIFKALKEKGASENSILIAAARGDVDEVEAFLTKGGDVNSEFEDGTTLLSHAVARGYKNLVLLLLSQGADINRVGRGRDAPIHVAVLSGDREMVDLLINEGAHVNITSARWKNWTPLHFAVSGAKREIAELLISRGANTEMKDSNDGMTPLVLAIWHHKAECLDLVKLLVEKGADVNSSTRWGDSALDLAVLQDNHETQEYLMARGAKTKYHTLEGTIEKILITQVMDRSVRDEKLKVKLKLNEHADDLLEEIDLGSAARFGLVVAQPIEGFSLFQRYSVDESHQGQKVKLICKKIREGRYHIASFRWVNANPE